MSSVKITNFRAYEKHSLRGFFTVELSSGLVLHGCKLFQKDAGNRWIGLPSEKFTDKNNAAGFRAIVEFSTREASDRFRDAVLEALDQIQPSSKSTSRQSAAKPASQSSGVPRAQIPADDFDDASIPF